MVMKFEVRAGVQKPAGGFTLVSGTALLATWAAYRQGDLRLFDLRVWFACLELTARRCGLIKGRSASYRIDEIHGLVGGVGGEHIRRSISRIEKSGLLTWSESSIVFPKSDAVLGQLGLGPMLDLVPNHRRLVPVPRRIVRLIAGGARRVVVATILGHLLRCLYYRGGVCLPEGTCKASWIAEAFGVNIRNVKAARKHLVSIGWLAPISTRQTCLNRFGQRVCVNLEWSRNDISANPKRSPPSAISTTESPPPYKDKKLSSRIYMNQKPESGPSGVSTQPKREGKPTLRHVVQQDLHDPRRLEVLHRQAIAAALISQSDCDKLRFFAAAEHAKAIGTQNPCGLFATVVRKGLWRYITQDDEDVAVQVLKRISPSCGTCDDEPSERRFVRIDNGPELDPAKIRALVQASLEATDERLPALKALEACVQFAS